MYVYNYIYMCLYIGIFLYFQWIGAAMPDILPQLNMWVSYAFLLWGTYSAGRIIVDCIMLNSKGQMTAAHMRDGILLSLLHFLPTFLMSVFMLKEGFLGK